MQKEDNFSIKEKDPETYKFFLQYWDYLKKYYIIQDNNDWWGCFISDLSSYVDRYSYSDFYVDLIMALYNRNINDYRQHDIKYISGFFKDWWAVLSEFYLPLRNNPDKQGPFVEAIQRLYDKYKKDTFLIDCIDILYNYKMPEVKTADSLKFVKQIYGLS